MGSFSSRLGDVLQQQPIWAGQAGQTRGWLGSRTGNGAPAPGGSAGVYQDGGGAPGRGARGGSRRRRIQDQTDRERRRGAFTPDPVGAFDGVGGITAQRPEDFGTPLPAWTSEDTSTVESDGPSPRDGDPVGVRASGCHSGQRFARHSAQSGAKATRWPRGHRRRNPDRDRTASYSRSPRERREAPSSSEPDIDDDTLASVIIRYLNETSDSSGSDDLLDADAKTHVVPGTAPAAAERSGAASSLSPATPPARSAALLAPPVLN